MSASLIAKARARLPVFHDGTGLVHQLVGSHLWKLVRLNDDDAPESTQATTVRRNLRRQLLVKLKIIFDYQLSFFVLRDFESYSLTTAGLSIPDRSFCFEAALYTLHIGAELERPSALETDDYNVLRVLVFTSFLAVFRALSLHRTSLAEEEGKVILQKVGHMCKVWEDQQPLSTVEALVLRRLIPQTLENIRLHEGGIIQTFCCGKCDERDYHNGQAAMCIDPSSLQNRINSLHCCHDLVQASIMVIDETSYVDAFWTLHDINWSLSIAEVQSAAVQITNHPASNEVKAASSQLWQGVRTLSSHLSTGTVNSDLCSYFQEIAPYLGEDGDFLFPTVQVESPADFQKTINDDIIEFEKELAILGGQASKASNTAAVPSIITLLPSLSRSTSIKPPISRNNSRGVERFHTSSPQQPTFYSPTTATTTNGSFGSPSPIDGGGARGRFSPYSPHPKSWGSDWSDGSTAFSPQHRDRQRLSSPLSTTPSSPVPRPSPPEASTPASTPTTKPPIPVDSGLQVVQEGLQVVQEQDHHNPTPPPPTPDTPHESINYMGFERQVSISRVSTPSELSSKESVRKTGFFRFTNLKKLSSSSSSHHSVSDKLSLTTSNMITTPEDLCFCFSVVGTSLLIWRKRNTDHVVKLILPFQNGQKLSLAQHDTSQNGSTSVWDRQTSNIKIVGAGNHLVAVVLASQDNKAYKLCCFNKYARRFDVQLQDTSLMPTALAVSRDDSKIAICCGGTVLIYEMVDNVGPKLAGSVPAHSRGSNLPANRRLQQANFSLDSTMLVTATQEYHGSEKSPYQVHVRLWRCLPETAPVLETELDPVVLDLGYGNDPGLSGIFCSIDHTNPMNSRVLLAAQTAKTYDYILMLSRQQKNKRLLLIEKSIGAAAQTMGPASSPPSTTKNNNNNNDNDTTAASSFFGAHYIFKNGKHDLYTMDIRTGVNQVLASFASERSGLKPDQEMAMVVGFPYENLALAFWRSKKGDLVLKQVDLSGVSGGRSATIHTLELRDVFQRVSLQG